jgi:predicted Ser/Thr protein kinase
MGDQRWRRIEEICHEALARSPDERAVFVREACAGDAALCVEVESLLTNQSRADALGSGLGIRDSESGSGTEELIGKEIGVYRIDALLGAGGMGVVYSAHDPRLQRTVAIKVLPQSFAVDAERLQRFEREARAAAALNHPNILAVYDVGRHQDRPFIVMEFVPGDTLAELLHHGRVPIPRGLEIGAEIADALSAAHASGVLHRDLKPSNVMIMPTGRVKVLDFGLAKMLASEAAPTDDVSFTGTRPRRFLGTPAYMAPERLRGQTGDHRADIFSLGVILFELVTGRRPFEGSDMLTLVSNMLTQATPLACEVEPEVPADISEFIAQMLSKEPSERPLSAALVKSELERLRHARRPVSSSRVVAGTAAPTRARALVRWLQHDAIIFLGALLAAAAFLRYFVIVAPTGELASHRQITFVGDATYPAISRDGQFLAYVVGPDGEQKVMVQDLASGHTREALEGQRFFDVRWSPDGTRLAFADEGSPADQVESISRKYQATTPAPRLPSSGGNGNSGGGGNGGNQ